MNFNHYQKQTEKTAVYPDEEALSYLALGVSGEAGEVAEKIKKHKRGDDLDLEKARKEIGDVLWYLARLSDELGFDLGDVAEENLRKTQDRDQRGKIKGEGDDR